MYEGTDSCRYEAGRNMIAGDGVIVTGERLMMDSKERGTIILIL